MSSDQPRKLAVLSALIFCLYCCKGGITWRNKQGASDAAAVTVGTSKSGGAVGPPVPSPPDRIFLFIGCLPPLDNAFRRPSVRHAWLDAANETKGVVARFVRSSAAPTAEDRDAGDILHVDAEEHDLPKLVLAVISHAQRQYDPAWILKCDGDAVVSILPLLQSLRVLCAHPSCAEDLLYVGHLRVGGQVEQEGPWSNPEYRRVSQLDTYVPYMYGGAYGITRRVAAALSGADATVGLAPGPVEDAQMGLWLAGLNVTRVHLPSAFWTASAPCCYRRVGPTIGRSGEEQAVELDLVDDTWALDMDPCPRDVGPLLVMRILPSPSCMAHLAHKLQACPPWTDAELRDVYAQSAHVM